MSDETNRMTEFQSDTRTAEVLLEVVRGTTPGQGVAFFDRLTKHLALALGLRCAWVTKWSPESRRLQALSFYEQGRFIEDYEYAVKGTPCEPVMTKRSLCHVPSRVIELFPEDPDLPPLDAVSYMGIPLELGDRLLGHLAVMDDKPMPHNQEHEALLRIFAARATAELQRLEGEGTVLQQEARLERVLRRTEDLQRALDAAEGFGEILGRSSALQRIMRDVHRVAGTEASVLITGETGTGKELVAREIHQKSARAEGPLVRVNCAAIPAGLQESEFFGHEKGAFTGATARREGRFALADGGTLFLDEVGELPLELQAKLLRALQEGEFEPVGGTKTRSVDVRVIAATNRSLEQMVSEGRFRQDLLYRVNVFPLRLPPLREREQDVLLLATAFLRQFSRNETAQLSSNDSEALLAYDWPGNVRELRNVVERAVITGVGSPDFIRALPGRGRSEREMAMAVEQEAKVLTVDELRELEKRNIERALTQCSGKVSGSKGAADLLGMKPNTLASRIKALQIRKPEIS